MLMIHKSAQTIKLPLVLLNFSLLLPIQKRYGNRTIALETLAAAPGEMSTALLHLRCRH